jgi:hypothetical protein
VARFLGTIASMWRSALMLALTLAACGRTGIDLGDDELGGDAGRALGAAGAAATQDASATGPDALTPRSCVVTFAVKGPYATGAAPISMVVSDFNQDGRPDLATSNWGGATGMADGSMSVLLANGPGTFAAQTMYPTDIQPNDLAAGDLTDDGLPDLIVAGGLMNLDEFRNTGGGAFAPRRGASLSEPLAVTVGDLDGDGRVDVAAAMISNAVDVFLTKADGSLRPTGQYATGPMTYGIAAADVDNDGRLDLLVTNVTFPPGAGLPEQLGMGRLGVYMNVGGGQFADEVVYPAGNGTSALAVADLDGDGDLDVAVTNDVDGTIGVFYNTGNGTFATQVAYAIAQTSSLAGALGMPGLVAADLDGDGHLDLATAWSNDDATIEILYNMGNGSFTHVSGPNAPSRPEAMATGDFDGDGRPDLAITDDKSVWIFLSRCR